MSKTISDWILELSSEDKKIRSEAIRALGYMGGAAVEPLLAALQANSIADDVLASILGQIGQPALDALNDLMEQGEPNTRAKVAQLLAKIGDARSVLPLIIAIDDPNEYVRMAAALALGSFSDPRAVSPLINILTDSSYEVRANAATALGSYYRDPRVLPEVIKAADDPHPLVRAGAARAMAQLHDERALAKLQKLTEDSDHDVRLVAAAAIQHQKGDKMVFERMKRDVSGQVDDLVNQILDDEEMDAANMDDLRNSNPRVRAKLLEVVGQRGGASAVKLLLPGLSDINPAVRQTAVDSLVRMGADVVEPLLDSLDSDSKFVRAGIIQALGIIGDERMIPLGNRLIHDDAEIVRIELVKALVKFGGRSDVIHILKVAQKDAHKGIRDLANAGLADLGDGTGGNPVSRFFRRMIGHDE